MTKPSTIFLGLLGAGIFTQMAPISVQATTISNGSYKFGSLESTPSGSGIGGYNVILFTHPAGGANNSNSGVNLDDANRGLPTGADSASASLFWMTSISDLRSFYDVQFGGAAKVNNIMLFLDVNEQGSGSNPINLETLTIYKNASTTPDGLDPFDNDLSSADQDKITGQFNGAMLKQLASSQSLDQIATGGGGDDWAIFTFIDPYSQLLSPSDSLLFNFKISGLDNGPESLSISGKLTSCDFDPNGCGATTGSTTGVTGTSSTAGSTTSSTGRTAGGTAEISEPASLILLIVGLIGLSRLRGKPVKR